MPLVERGTYRVAGNLIQDASGVIRGQLTSTGMERLNLSLPSLTNAVLPGLNLLVSAVGFAVLHGQIQRFHRDVVEHLTALETRLRRVDEALAEKIARDERLIAASLRADAEALGIALKEDDWDAAKVALHGLRRAYFDRLNAVADAGDVATEAQLGLAVRPQMVLLALVSAQTAAHFKRWDRALVYLNEIAEWLGKFETNTSMSVSWSIIRLAKMAIADSGPLSLVPFATSEHVRSTLLRLNQAQDALKLAESEGKDLRQRVDLLLDHVRAAQAFDVTLEELATKQSEGALLLLPGDARLMNKKK